MTIKSPEVTDLHEGPWARNGTSPIPAEAKGYIANEVCDVWPLDVVILDASTLIELAGTGEWRAVDRQSGETRWVVAHPDLARINA